MAQAAFSADLALCHSIGSAMKGEAHPAPHLRPTCPPLNQGILKLEPKNNALPAPGVLDQHPLPKVTLRPRRYVAGVEIDDHDLICLQNPSRQITGTIMNAYAHLVPDRDRTLTTAGCIILSSVVPNIMRGEISCGNTLENIISVVSASVKVRIFKLKVIPTPHPDNQK
jgi:hypothetical protein